jgi:hypothetical protein
VFLESTVSQGIVGVGDYVPGHSVFVVSLGRDTFDFDFENFLIRATMEEE